MRQLQELAKASWNIEAQNKRLRDKDNHPPYWYKRSTTLQHSMDKRHHLLGRIHLSFFLGGP